MMVNMGYSRKDIEESLIQQKYNDVMATYLLLARRGSDVSRAALWPLQYTTYALFVISQIVRMTRAPSPSRKPLLTTAG